MFIHYQKTAFHNLWKYKTQSIISIVGLAVGFTCFSLAFLWMHYEKSYDSFYKDAERIHLIRKIDRMISSYSTGANRSMIPEAFPAYLRQNFPEVEKTSVFNPSGQNTDVKYHDQVFNLKIMDVDDSFVDIFGLTVIEGDLLFLRNTPENKIALCEKQAKRIFGKESALGKTVVFNDLSEYIVAAIIKDLEGPSNFPFDILIKKHESEEKNWSISVDICFVKLYPNVNIETFKEKIGNITAYEKTSSPRGAL